MSYCTLDDLKKQIDEWVLIDITSDPNAEERALNQDVIDAAINSADAEINSYAQEQYDVPFNPVPEMIKKLSIDITLYNLFSRRGEIKEKDSNITLRYKAAVRFLENLAKRLVTIGVTTGQPAPPPPVTTEIRSSPRIFTRDSMKGM